MEMKKSYSPFGSTPLSVDEVLPDIQTGRAVYPDKDKEADTSYMERINQYKHEGFHDVSEDDGGSSGGGDSSSGGGGTSEPLIVKATRIDTETRRLYFDATPSDVLDAIEHNRQVFFQVDNSADINAWALMYFNPSTVVFRGTIDLLATTLSDIMLKADGYDSNYYYQDTNGDGVHPNTITQRT